MLLPPEYDVKGLILSRRDLFRPGGRRLLGEWKSHMLAGTGLPLWISSIEDQVERLKAINDLSVEDVFVSQFRTDPGAPRPSIDVIDWGLKHIERLRSAAGARRAERLARWNSRATNISLLIALGTVAATWWGIHEQAQLKQYEVTFVPKQLAYSELMSSFDETTVVAFKHDEKATLANLSRMETSFFKLQPFLSPSTETRVFSQLNAFRNLCTKMVDSRLDTISNENDRKAYQQLTIELARLKDDFKDTLYPALFR
jgi:hypothetical protein